MKKTVWLAVLLACLGAKDALAIACVCKITSISNNSADATIIDLTGTVNATCPTACTTKCSAVAKPYFSNPGFFCSKGNSGPTRNGVQIGVQMGTCSNFQPYQMWGFCNNSFCTLTNIPAVVKTVCTCPRGWTCNGCSPQVAGGVTSDGKCKKGAGATTLSPAPPDGTALGAWGFSWGTGIYAWGTAANGGAPKCVVTQISPAQCHF